jgi:hypothetical protein
MTHTHAVCPTSLIIFYFIALRTLREATNYEVSPYATFSSLLLVATAQVGILPEAPYSQM